MNLAVLLSKLLEIYNSNWVLLHLTRYSDSRPLRLAYFFFLRWAHSHTDSPIWTSVGLIRIQTHEDQIYCVTELTQTQPHQNFSQAEPIGLRFATIQLRLPHTDSSSRICPTPRLLRLNSIRFLFTTKSGWTLGQIAVAAAWRWPTVPYMATAYTYSNIIHNSINTRIAYT